MVTDTRNTLFFALATGDARAAAARQFCFDALRKADNNRALYRFLLPDAQWSPEDHRDATARGGR